MEIKSQYLTKNTDETLNYTLGVVYEPHAVDTDGQWTDEEEIRKAMWDYMDKLQGEDDVTKISKQILEEVVKAAEKGYDINLNVDKIPKKFNKKLKDMHSRPDNESTIVECYQTPIDMEIQGEQVKKGAWMLGVRWSDEAFEKILSGERNGLSMGGSGIVVNEEPNTS